MGPAAYWEAVGYGTIDLNDILAVLDAFGGNYAC